MNTIEINIVGPTASGKTTLAELIYIIVSQTGIKCQNNDIDCQDESAREHLINHLSDKVKAVAEQSRIVINTVCVK